MLPPILRLLRAELPVEIRLMGVRGSNLRKAPQSLDQLAAGGRKLNALERLVLQAKQQQEQAQQGQQQDLTGLQSQEGQQDLQQQQQAAGATDVGEVHQQQPPRLEAAAAAAGPHPQPLPQLTGGPARVRVCGGGGWLQVRGSSPAACRHSFCSTAAAA